jgi:sporulation protein YlmC with PRC-barrel domain
VRRGENMILGSELEKFEVVDSLGEEVGQVKDVIVDTTKKEWNVKEIIVSKGILKGEAVFSLNAINKLDEEEKSISLKEGAELEDFDEEKFTHTYLSMDAVKDRNVFSSDEEEIGKIYDYVIADSLTPWQVIKILIRPHLHFLTGRRIRLDVENISKIKDVITLNLSKKELEKKAKNE